jgi:hypothetical protein
MTEDEARELAEGEIIEYRQAGGQWAPGEVDRALNAAGTVAIRPRWRRSGVICEVRPIDLRR